MSWSMQVMHLENNNSVPDWKVWLFLMRSRVCKTVSRLLKCACSTSSAAYIQHSTSGEASTTFGHANANFSVLIDRIRTNF